MFLTIRHLQVDERHRTVRRVADRSVFTSEPHLGQVRLAMAHGQPDTPVQRSVM